MKNILKYMIVVIAMLSCLWVPAENSAKNSFTVDIYDYVFMHETPSYGTFISSGEGTESMLSFTESYGTFEAFPIDRANVIIISESYSEACGLMLKIESEGIVNLQEGTFESIFVELTLTNTKTGLSVTTSDIVASGYLNPLDFDSLVVSFTGSFDRSFKPNKFKGCKSKPDSNNGFGNGDQDAPGKSGSHNNAENAVTDEEDEDLVP